MVFLLFLIIKGLAEEDFSPDGDDFDGADDQQDGEIPGPEDDDDFEQQGGGYDDYYPQREHHHHHKYSKTGKRLHHRRKRNSYYGYYDDSEYWEDFYYYMLDENGKPLCGDNAEIVDRKCVCKKGYPHGNPRTYPGCYRCKDKCSRYGRCVHPGNCECQYGYEGNGTWCTADKPSVKAISDVIDGKINATTNFESDDQMHEGFCKFGDIITPAVFACNQYLTCTVPDRLQDQVIFQVSYDGEKWSDSSVVFQNNDNLVPPSGAASNKVLVIVFIGSMIVLVILLYNSKPVEVEEAQPFIRERPKPKPAAGVVKRNII